MEKLGHYHREHIPEHVVHAKGTSASGYFEVTADFTKWTKAKSLSEVGKKTEAFARFSTVGGEKGSADAERDPRGFAVKFYKEEGNYDFVGNNTQVFFIRDPIKIADFIHTQKRHPATSCKDWDMFWETLITVAGWLRGSNLILTRLRKRLICPRKSVSRPDFKPMLLLSPSRSE